MLNLYSTISLSNITNAFSHAAIYSGFMTSAHFQGGVVYWLSKYDQILLLRPIRIRIVTGDTSK